MRIVEYTINTGVAPTLVYPIPTTSPFLSLIIKSLRDYYPLYQLVYQSFVFISRSSLSLLRLPPLPRSLLPLPTVVQLCLLALMVLESSTGFIESIVGENGAIYIVLVMVALEGISGGSVPYPLSFLLVLTRSEMQVGIRQRILPTRKRRFRIERSGRWEKESRERVLYLQCWIR